jgi:hypothetical protein
MDPDVRYFEDCPLTYGRIRQYFVNSKFNSLKAGGGGTGLMVSPRIKGEVPEDHAMQIHWRMEV